MFNYGVELCPCPVYPVIKLKHLCSVRGALLARVPAACRHHCGSSEYFSTLHNKYLPVWFVKHFENRFMICSLCNFTVMDGSSPGSMKSLQADRRQEDGGSTHASPVFLTWNRGNHSRTLQRRLFVSIQYVHIFCPSSFLSFTNICIMLAAFWLRWSSKSCQTFLLSC